MTYLDPLRFERAVDATRQQTEVRLSLADAEALRRTGGYQKSFGLKFWGRHYRKRRGDGCYHLMLFDHHATLHWDRSDPRRHPLDHFAETPVLWVPTVAVAGIAMIGAAVAALSRDDE